MISLDLYNKAKTSISAKAFVDLLGSALTTLIKEKTAAPTQKYRVELTLVGDRSMRQLNKKYHNKDRTTDVISLSFFSKKMSDDFVGEIFISVPYARRQALKIRQSLKEELQFLFVHGLLHLFGYDHMKPVEEAHMKHLTYKILGRL